MNVAAGVLLERLPDQKDGDHRSAERVRYCQVAHLDAASITMLPMRTTIDLPEDLHRIAKAVAHDCHQTLSEAVATIMRRGIDQETPATFEVDPRTGFLVMHGGPIVTSEDVRALEDDD